MRTALFLLLVCSFGTAVAETVYISDVLRVGIRAQPNSSDTPIAVVTSGAALKVLTRQGGYLQVRTEDGVEGWINDNYATAEEPAKMRLQRIEAERDRLKGELERLRKNASAGSEQAEQQASQLQGLQEENARLQQGMDEITEQLRQKESGSGWIYYMLLLIALFLAGIYLGVRWNKERVAQRLGGLEL